MKTKTQDRRSGTGFGFEEFDGINNNPNAIDMAALMESMDAQPKALVPGLFTTGSYIGSGYVSVRGAKFDVQLHPLDLKAGEPARGLDADVIIVSNRDGEGVHADEGATLYASFLMAKDWLAVREAKASGTSVRGTVVFKVMRRGNAFTGYKVRVGNVVGFLHASQLRGIPNAQSLLNLEIDVDVLAAEPESNTLKFSAKSLHTARIERFAAIKVDDLCTGSVRKVLEFGVLVDIGDGCTGLLHRSEMNPGAFGTIAEGDQLDVVIIRKEAGAERFSLSQRLAARRAFAQQVHIGAEVTGEVNGVMQFGVFVQLKPGVSGLLHRSRFNGTQPTKGEKLTVRVLKVESNGERIDLGLV